MFYRKCSKRRKMKVILCGTVMYVLTMWLIGESELRIFNTGKKQVLPSKPGLLPAPKYGTGESVVKIQTYSPSIQTCSLSILSLSGQRILRNMEICWDDLTPRDYFTGSWTKTQFWMAAMLDEGTMKIHIFSQRREFVFFLPSNMAAMQTLQGCWKNSRKIKSRGKGPFRCVLCIQGYVNVNKHAQSVRVLLTSLTSRVSTPLFRRKLRLSSALPSMKD